MDEYFCDLDTRVNVGDTNQTKSLSGQPLTDGDNFHSDVNLDGRINVGTPTSLTLIRGPAFPKIKKYCSIEIQ
jgi:hypothetical protein